jgi:hypothetical protein
MWKRLNGKHCKIVSDDGHGAFVRYGTVIDANDSFIVSKDRFGKIHFLNTSSIERISEHPKVMGLPNKKEKVEPNA